MRFVEMEKTIIGGVFVLMYRIKCLRRWIIGVILRLEGGEILSKTLRVILEKYHGVVAGDYSYGEGLIPGKFPRGVKIGRYVSIASDVKVFLRNHPLERMSMHPFFYNSALGVVEKDTVEFGALEISHDAWIGANVIIAAGCTRIGVGSVVAGGSVVTKNVPDFAIVGGAPAKLIRYRFDSDEEREMILTSRWWERNISFLSIYLDVFTVSLNKAENKSLEKIKYKVNGI